MIESNLKWWTDDRELKLRKLVYIGYLLIAKLVELLFYKSKVTEFVIWNFINFLAL